jgi:hypothetical protein
LKGENWGSTAGCNRHRFPAPAGLGNAPSAVTVFDQSVPQNTILGLDGAPGPQGRGSGAFKAIFTPKLIRENSGCASIAQ